LLPTNKPNVSAAKTIKKSFKSELAETAAAAWTFPNNGQNIRAPGYSLIV
jgi:hypothetical protein